MKRKVVLGLGLWLLAALLAPLMGASAQGPELDAARREALDKTYLGVLGKAGLTPQDLVVYSIGQSHIDAAWRWRKKQTRHKCVVTFGNAVEHMEMYPDFHFSGSAPQYYEWVMEDAPDLFEKIKYYEKKGQWEIVGGQWVEPDNVMPDGESFCRQRLLGQRFYMEHFGHTADISWLLDSFGYNWNLPQFLAKSGAKYFWTNKLTWNDTTVFPFHFFHWQAPDGSTVLAYFVQQAGAPLYFPANELSKYHDTRYLLPEGASFTADYSTEPSAMAAAMSPDWLNVIGVFYGKGDGGHGPTPTEIMIQRAYQQSGYTKLAPAADLYAALEPYADRAPTWNDELYLEYHRGCQTTHGAVKRANRQSEQSMRTAEVLQSVASRRGFTYAYNTLKAIWKLVLLNQFHDILPGSSIPEVYADAAQDYQQILTIAHAASRDALAYLADRVDTSNDDKSLKPVMVFNTLAWQRDGVVTLKDLPVKDYTVVDHEGNVMPSQWSVCPQTGNKQLLFAARGVPSVGYQVYYLKEGKAPTGDGPTASDDPGVITLSNDLVTVKIDKTTGWLTSVHDEALDREFLKGPGNQLMAFHDKASRYPAWNIQKDYLDHPYDMPDASSVEVTARGPLFVEVTAKRRFKHSDIVQVTRLFAGDPRVHLSTHFDFHDKNVLVKQGFDTTVKTDKITAEIPYATIDRPTVPKTAAEQARWEAVVHRWMDLSDGDGGLALLNNGKYGYSLNPDGMGYRLTILKAALYPDSAKEAVKVSHANLPHWLRGIADGVRVTDQGPHSVWTALLPHAGNWREDLLWRAGYEFNTPLEAALLEQHEGELGADGSFITLDNPHVYLGAVKRAEDDDSLVMRLVEAVGSESKVTVKITELGRIQDAMETDLLEWNPRAIDHDAAGFTVTMKPYEVKTIKVVLAD